MSGGPGDSQAKHPGLPWEIIGQETLYQDSWRALRRDRLRLHTGQESSYVFLQTLDATFVVPQLEDGRVALLRQYRHPVRAWIWEVPAGSLESGETPEAAGTRELAEEMGGIAASWHHLGVFCTAVTHLADRCTYLLAQGVTLGEARPELHELAEIHLFAPAEALALVRQQTPTHPVSAHSALALLLAEPFLVPI